MARARKKTSGQLIDELFDLREHIRLLEADVKELKKQKDVKELELIEVLDKEGISKATGAKASVGISETVKPNVEDWDEFYRFVHKNKAYHLLERRPSVLGCRELFELKGGIPGVAPFVQRTLTLRTLK